ncbi:DeoR-type HTH domain protein [Acididesulfobacillus acetoxydans]|uniref:Lactose phosphotransferase system repressor n=1 Tax=Acididesulfobacillus acetoxydans TaxID=1561005 RepID=A0A8S0WGI8_9FIRM|nr:DeoR/GlpR family DNA-binding transcription regulator [Acididesulfobacillus acetoxydans]CAA7601922.1 DeoR-type HTH domain protein [Acididesulfobacillus acetoxydans]CEJ08234.1 Transcriptional regulator, DeoR [Acididesulfobacillus acetoxydans]
MTNERQEEIRLLLQQHGHLTVAELAKSFGVSDMTIRRDLKHLAGLGLVRREHGKASYLQSAGPDTLFLSRLGEFEREKTAIGAMAASLIAEGEPVIFDAGTTTLAVAQFVSAGCVAITNSLPIAGVLGERAGVTVLVTGGELRGTTFALVGPLTRSTVSGFNAEKLFLAASGMDLERGLSTTSMLESEVKQEMLSSAKKVILVAHSQKMGRVYYHTFAHWDRVDILVTDSGLTEPARRSLTDRGVEVLIANPARRILPK